MYFGGQISEGFGSCIFFFEKTIDSKEIAWNDKRESISNGYSLIQIKTIILIQQLMMNISPLAV